MRKLLPINWLLFTVIFSAYLITLSIYVYNDYINHKNEIMEDIDKDLYTSAVAMKFILPDNLHDRAIDEHSISTEEDMAIANTLTSFVKETGFKYAYTIIKKKSDLFFIASDIVENPETERGTFYFYPYKEADKSFFDAFDKKEPTYKTVSDQWGTVRTVMVIENSPNGIKYLACIDCDISYVKGFLQKNLLRSVATSLFFLFLIVPILIIYTKLYSKFSSSLGASEKKYRSLANNLNIGVYRNSIDAKGKFIEANPAIVKMFGYDNKEEFLKVDVSNLYKNLEDNSAYNTKLLQKNEIRRAELKLQKKDGTFIIGSVSAVVVKDEKGKPKYSDGVIEDITEMKYAQESLRKSEDKYRKLFEKSADAIFVVDRMTGKYLEVNEAGEKLTGRSTSELKKLTVQDVTHEGAAQRLKDIVFVNKTSNMGEITYVHPDGTKRIAQLNAVPLDGKTIYGIAQDITDQKRSEKEQKKLQEKLTQVQKMEAIGTLAGGIAHDFNNILSGIIGYSQLAEIYIHEPEKAKANIKNIVIAASRATELVQQILTFSRKKEYEKQFFKLFTIVKEVLKLIRATIPSTIEINENINSKAIIFADPTQMHQLVINLCTNAYHAMNDSGGELKVRLDEIFMSDQNRISIKNTGQHKYIELEITDTGKGMDEKTIEKIFNPYFTTKTREKGTGLGLAIVHAIVEEHNGIIRVNSTVGKGSTFLIYLPIVEKKETADKSELLEQEIIKGTESILFVEDEENIRSFSQEFLENYGYTLTMFENGQKAYEEFKRDPDRFDIVITDMTMPKMNGDELSEKILKIRKDIPIILCTGYSEKFNAVLAKKIGISRYIEKPFAGKEMCSLIREVLGTA